VTCSWGSRTASVPRGAAKAVVRRAMVVKRGATNFMLLRCKATEDAAFKILQFRWPSDVLIHILDASYGQCVT